MKLILFDTKSRKELTKIPPPPIFFGIVSSLWRSLSYFVYICHFLDLFLYTLTSSDTFMRKLCHAFL